MIGRQVWASIVAMGIGNRRSRESVPVAYSPSHHSSKWLFRHFAGALAIDEVAYGPDYHAMARVIRTYEQGGSPRRNSNCRDRPVDSRLAAWAQHRRCP